MALPTTTEVLAADASFRGQPFVRIPLNADNLFTMDYSFRGEPFVSNCAIPTPIKLIGVSFNHVNNFLGVNSENCGKIVGVEPT